MMKNMNRMMNLPEIFLMSIFLSLILAGTYSNLIDYAYSEALSYKVVNPDFEGKPTSGTKRKTSAQEILLGQCDPRIAQRAGDEPRRLHAELCFARARPRARRAPTARVLGTRRAGWTRDPCAL